MRQLYDRHGESVLAAAGVLILLAMRLSTGELVYTGDEPRYSESALSIFAGTPFDHYNAPIHLLPLVPFMGWFGQDAGRWGAFVVSLLGFVVVAALCRRITSPLPAFVVSLVCFASLPAFAYGFVLYPAIWLATCLAVALLLLDRDLSVPAIRWGCVLAALLLPFLHLRMALAAAAVMAIFAWLEWRRLPGFAAWFRAMLPVGVVSALALAALLAFQYAYSGKLLGTASAAYSPSNSNFFERLAMQSLTLRHGLFIYNPVMLAALAGLVGFAIRGQRLACFGLVVLCAYTATFVWGAASESPPARFWVPMVPVFAIGLSFWVSRVRSLPAQVLTLFLLVLSVLNVFLFTQYPNRFLENREVPVTYDMLFSKYGLFYLPNHIPWDKWFFIEMGYPGHFELSMEKLLPLVGWMLALTGLLVVTAIVSKRRLAAFASSLAALLLTAGLLYQTIAHVVPTDRFEIDREPTALNDRGMVTLTFQDAVRPIAVRFKQSQTYWPINAYPDEFDILSLGEGGEYREVARVPAGWLTFIPPIPPTRGLMLRPVLPSPPDSRWLAGEISVIDQN